MPASGSGFGGAQGAVAGVRNDAGTAVTRRSDQGTDQGKAPIGATLWTLPSRGVRGLEVAAGLGFDIVHIDHRDLNDGIGALLKTAAACDIRIGGISLSSAEALGLSDRGRLLTEIRDVSRSARELNAPFVYLPSFGEARIDDDADLRATRWALQTLLDETAECDTIVATENGLSAQECAELFDRIPSSRLRLLFDTQNPVVFGFDAADHARLLGGFVGPFVHLKDGVAGLGDAAVGAGVAGVHRTVEALFARGWRGTFVVETDYAAVGLDVATQDIRTAQRLRAGCAE